MFLVCNRESLVVVWTSTQKHQYGECYCMFSIILEDLHALVQTCAEARVAHICRTSGRQESEQLLGTIVGQYRRLMSTCAVRAQAMCTLARVGLITPAARDAARRRQVAMRMEEQMRKERRAQWMASLQGPGWARRGRCHGL